jgi:hypothetical protein
MVINKSISEDKIMYEKKKAIQFVKKPESEKKDYYFQNFIRKKEVRNSIINKDMKKWKNEIIDGDQHTKRLMEMLYWNINRLIVKQRKN